MLNFFQFLHVLDTVGRPCGSAILQQGSYKCLIQIEHNILELQLYCSINHSQDPVCLSICLYTLACNFEVAINNHSQICFLNDFIQKMLFIE